MIRKDEGPIERKGREERDKGMRDLSVFPMGLAMIAATTVRPIYI